MPDRRLLLATAAVLCVGLLVVLLATGGVRDGSEADAAVARKLPPGQPLTIVWGGDVTLGSSYGQPPDRARGMLARVAPTMRKADLTTVNLEGTLGSGGSSKCAAGAANCFAFQAPAANVAGLRVGGVDAVNLANNHAFDFGATGMGQTILALRSARIAFTGRPGEIRYVNVGRSRVALLGFSSYRWTSPIRDLAAVRRMVADAAGRANQVVVFLHGGAEGAGQTHVPFGEEQAFGEQRGNLRAFAHTAVDAGADLVLGSGPHVLRGIEIYRKRTIAYSLGNLAGYRNFSRGGTLSLSGLLRVEVDADGALTGGRLVPLKLVGPGLPAIDGRHAAVRLVAGVSRGDFGARAIRLSPSGRILNAPVRPPKPQKKPKPEPTTTAPPTTTVPPTTAAPPSTSTPASTTVPPA
jgi:Bacterial capsule synthesis protein PGA_cap